MYAPFHIKMRWLPRDIPDKECDFLEGLITYGASLFDFCV
jgi:hypothetical protein